MKTRSIITQEAVFGVLDQPHPEGANARWSSREVLAKLGGKGSLNKVSTFMKLYYARNKSHSDVIAIYNKQKDKLVDKILDIITTYVEQTSSDLESTLANRNSELEKANLEIERREEAVRDLESRLAEAEVKLRISDASLTASKAAVEGLRAEISSIEGKYQRSLQNEAFYKGKYEALVGAGNATEAAPKVKPALPASSKEKPAQPASLKVKPARPASSKAKQARPASSKASKNSN